MIENPRALLSMAALAVVLLILGVWIVRGRRKRK